MRKLLTSIVVLLTLTLSGALHAVPTGLGEGHVISPGVRLWTTTLHRTDGDTTVWIYLPNPMPKAQVPCVLIAPAGTPLVVGMNLSDDDHADHIPYVQAGMAVLAYSISGAADPSLTADQAAGPATQYMEAHSGLSDEMAALDYALKNVPDIDPKRIFGVGHSSAGTLALFVAEMDPRIAA